jgi:hypothetical protein
MTTDDDIDAAWAAVHDALPGRMDCGKARAFGDE